MLHRSACVAILVFAIAIRLVHLDQPMRPDESWTFLDFALQPLSGALSDYSRPNNHIFHTLLMWMDVRVLGYAPWVIRLPAFFAGVLMVPATYAATRVLAGGRAAIFAAALTAALPGLVLYSTNARGYSIVCLCFLCLIPIANALADEDSVALWIAFAALVALGAFTVPVMLYPVGATGLWILVERARRNGMRATVSLVPRLAAATALAIALTLLAYAPVITRSGFAPLVSNQYVTAHTWQQIIGRDIAWLLRNMRVLHGLGIPGFLVATFALAGVLGFFASSAERAKRGTLFISLAVWCLFLVLMTRRPPPARAWLFLAPVACLYVGVGLALGADLLSRVTRVRAEILTVAVASLLAVSISVTSLVNRTVFNAPDNGTLIDGPAIARTLLAEIHGDDRVVAINGGSAVIDYYLYTITGKRLAEFDSPSRTGRVLVVVNPAYRETMRTVQTMRTDVRWTEMDEPVLLKKFSSASIYQMRPRALGIR
jgi:4-amino-4-deoxy-L-arabinose transferase-like glycosyltransferase